MRTPMRIATALSTALLSVLPSALLSASPAAAATHVVTQSGFTFQPDQVLIDVGDTVVWQWSSLSHTVTSGTGAADPQVGQKFDAALNSANPTFSFTFTTPGTVPYFCRPHEFMGMSGRVVVQNVSAVDQVPARGPLTLTSAPNPFNPRTVISFVLPATAGVRVSVSDAAGRSVRVLADGAVLEAGRHEIDWNGLGDDGRAAPAGIYLATVEAGDVRETVKLTLAK